MCNSDPDITLAKAPSQVWETDVELKEGGTLGEGRRFGAGPMVWQLREALCSLHLFLIIQLCVCVSAYVCVCVHFRSSDADIIL